MQENRLTPEDAVERELRFFAEARRDQCVWALMRDGGYAHFVEDDSSVVPLWTYREGAESCAEVSFSRYEPVIIHFEKLIEALRALGANEGWVAVNPTPECGGIQVPAMRVVARLSEPRV